MGVLVALLLSATGLHSEDLFERTGAYATNRGPWSMCTADFNSDGYPDLAITYKGVSQVTVLFNNGNGAFADTVEFPTGNGVYEVCAGDLDGDGDQDLVFALTTDQVSVILNDGAGSFTGPTKYATGSSSVAVCVADLDGDGSLDIATANRSSEDASIFLNKGDGTFEDAVEYRVSEWCWPWPCPSSCPRDVCAADFDDDGDCDLAFVACAENYFWYYKSVIILKNDANAVFSRSGDYGAGYIPASICTADLDGDSDMDLAIGNYGMSNWTMLIGHVVVLRNDSTGAFSNITQYGGYDVGTYQVIPGDWDGDGYIDLAAPDLFTNKLHLMMNQQDGSFTWGEEYSIGGDAYALTAADFDGDTDLDLAVAVNGSDSVEILANNTCSPTDAPDDQDQTLLPDGFLLSQNYPNPFNPTTTIEYYLSQRTRVTLSVYNILGRRVTTLVDGVVPSGWHSVEWNSRDAEGQSMAGGVYLYCLNAGDRTEAGKMVLLK